MSVTFTKLFSSITASTIWAEPDHTRLVWITMLAMSDQHGRVWASIPGLANMARVTIERCEDALLALSSPDKYSRTKEHEGRRIEEMDGGWRLLNHGKYRSIRDEESTKESKRKYINARRAAEREGVEQSRSLSNSVELCRDNTEADTEAEAKRKKTSPLSGFGEFWASWPKSNRKGGKGECEKLWRRDNLETIAGEIVAHVQAMALTDNWRKQGGEFIPAPAVYLRGKRWDGAEVHGGGSSLLEGAI